MFFKKQKEKKLKMEFINLSDKPLIFKGSKKGLKKMVVLPDYCPGRGVIPVGLVAVYDRKNHVISSDYLGPDVSCGMTLARFKPREDLEYLAYGVASKLELLSKELGSLGRGNHFVDIYEVTERKENAGVEKGEHLVLVHSGSRLKGQKIYAQGLEEEEYTEAFSFLSVTS
tara:strand:- start:16 stop:528 length:513 start_codon:yes stop_codon:yes gene_type:complete